MRKQRFRRICFFMTLIHYINRIGGKFYLAPKLVPHIMPYLIDNDFKYCEPFFGGGSVYFALKGNIPNMYAFLGDIDAEVMNFWKVAVTRTREFHDLSISCPHDESLLRWFYDTEFDDELIKAFAFYYIGKASLFGKGTVSVPTIKTGSENQFAGPARREFLSLTKAMSNTTILNKDFGDIIDIAVRYNKNIVIYCDPPYYGTEYYYKGIVFGEAEHIRLRVKLEGKNFVVSYNDCEFIRKLYAGYEIIKLKSTQMMKPKGTKTTKEIVIKGRR